MPTRISPIELGVFLFVEPERHLRSADQNRAPDQVRLRHHQIDGFLLRFRQRTLLEHGTSRAHEIEKVVLVDVLFEERAIRWVTIDVALFDADSLLLQITSGVAARRSRRLPEEGRLGHARHFMLDRRGRVPRTPG